MAKSATTTKKFKALVAVLGSEEAARTAWDAANPSNPVAPVEADTDPQVKLLVEAGFSPEDAEKYAAQVSPTSLTSKEQVDVAIAKRGLVPVRGRVYGTFALIEACVRVLKTGKPEVVDLAGERHIKAVAIWRTDDGESFAQQNLGEPN